MNQHDSANAREKAPAFRGVPRYQLPGIGITIGLGFAIDEGTGIDSDRDYDADSNPENKAQNQLSIHDGMIGDCPLLLQW